MRLNIVLVSLVCLLAATRVAAVDFTGQVQQDGKLVISNIPAECVQDGVLICLQYHPMNQQHFNQSQPEVGNTPGQSVQNNLQPKINRTTAAREPTIQSSGQQGNVPQLDVLRQLVEMNQMLDEYFPGKGSAEDQARVRQQQGQIRQMLGIVERAAGDEVRPTIRQAIEIFQSGMQQ